jgi:hypothetical protein
MRRSIGDQISQEPIDVLQRRPSKAKRDRSWETEQREKLGQVSYRGIPAELNERVRALAKELDVITGEVARALMAHGLAAYEKGELELAAEEKPEHEGGRCRHTLYPPMYQD